MLSVEKLGDEGFVECTGELGRDLFTRCSASSMGASCECDLDIECEMA